MIQAMLAEELTMNKLPDYLDNDKWWIEQKLDGHRVLVHSHDGTATAYNRNGDPYTKPFPQEVLDDLSRLSGGWIVDGELVGDTYWVFDLPMAAGDLLARKAGGTLEWRRQTLEALLEAAHIESVKLIPYAATKQSKTDLVRRALTANAEGVILKHSYARYEEGRSSRMLKVKFVKTLDAIVMETWREGKESISVGLYGPDGLQEVGAVSMIGKNIDDIKVGEVVEVRYLYATKDARLYQPVFLHRRGDKRPEECVMDQMQVTNKEVLRWVSTHE